MHLNEKLKAQLLNLLGKGFTYTNTSLKLGFVQDKEFPGVRGERRGAGK